MQVYVTTDNGPHKKGAVVTMDYRDAIEAIKAGWAKPLVQFSQTRETR